MINKKSNTVKPPLLLSWLIEKMIDPQIRDQAMGDLEEQYRMILRDTGRLSANLNFLLQIKAVFSSYMSRLFIRSIAMFSNYLKVSLRNISNNKYYSIINISGLGIGLAVFLMMFLYVKHELGYDRYHENADRIYRVVSYMPDNTYLGKSYFAVTPSPLAEALINDYPEIELAARINDWNELQVSSGNKRSFEERCFFADSNIFNIFHFSFIRKQSDTLFNDSNSIVISEGAANKYFGEDDPIGKELVLKNEQKLLGDRYERSFIITGIFENMPENSHVRMDLIIPMETFFEIIVDDSEEWADSGKHTYVLLKENSDYRSLDKKIRNMQKNYPVGNLSDDFKREYYLQPVTDIHLKSNMNFELESNGNIYYVYIFSAMGILILVMACVNYTNLATARFVSRSREVGLRKVIGASRGQLVIQFLGESLLLTVFALILSIAVNLFILPYFNSLVGTDLGLENLKESFFIPSLLIIILLTWISAGLYPALFISGIKPVSILKGKQLKKTRGISLRNSLIVFQFAFLTFMIVLTLVIKDQMNFIMSKDAGYSREQIIVIELEDQKVRDNIEALKIELLKNHDIEKVSSSLYLPDEVNSQTVARWKGWSENLPRKMIYFNFADIDYIELYEIEIVEGRNFSEDYSADKNGAFLINEAAAKVLNWRSPLEKEMILWSKHSGRIVGVMKDFHMQSFHEPIKPLMIYQSTDLLLGYLSVKAEISKLDDVITYIEAVFNKFSPNYPFEYTFFDKIFESKYRNEQKLSGIFGLTAVIAIILACFGLFGLAAFTGKQRIKEIGIRKVLGASVSGITLLLSKEFLILVLIADAIALPAALILMQNWLQQFVYRVDIDLYLVIASALAGILITFFTTGYQTLKSAVSNPVDILRSE